MQAERDRSANQPAMKRVEILDYLRGLMAVSVMLYHYLVAAHGPLGSESVIGLLGIYAVATFYVLSGLSLTIVYQKRFRRVRDYRGYAIKRVLRIAPLFAAAVTLVVLLGLARNLMGQRGGFSLDPWQLVLNYSLLFGFVAPTAYLPTGAWSIGNEMVFYAFFPLLIVLGRRARSWAVALAGAFLVPYVWFAFTALRPDVSLASQWPVFVNPFNQAFLFVAGVTVGLLVKPAGSDSGRAAAVHGLLVVALAAAFAIIPVRGDQVRIATGSLRLLFSALCIGTCLVLYHWNAVMPVRPVRSALKFLGEASYSVYLLHPIVGLPVTLVTARLGLPGLPFYVGVCVPATLFLAYLSYRYVEQPAMRFASRVTANRDVPPSASIAAGTGLPAGAAASAGEGPAD